MRAFIAIELPVELKPEIIKLQDQLPKEGCKLTKTKEFHCTIEFLGEIKEEYVDEVKQKLSSVDFVKFNLTLGNIGVFPHERYVRVVWLGFKENSRINDLKKLINDLLDFKDDKRFHAHVTLARVKSIDDVNSFARQIRTIKIPELSFPVNEIKLIRSELTPEGPVYTDLAVFKLKK